MASTVDSAADELRGGVAHGQMVGDILREIGEHRLAPGDRLASEVALGERYRISVSSVRRGMEILVERGILVRRRGSGTYVARQVPELSLTKRDTIMLGWEWEYGVFHPYYSELLRGLRVGLEAHGWKVWDPLSRRADGGQEPTPEQGGIRYRYPDQAAILAELAGRRELAGVVATPSILNLLPESSRREWPVVALGPHPRVPFVSYDWGREVTRAVEAALVAGARRLAVFSDHDPEFIRPAIERARRMAGGEAEIEVHRVEATRVTSVLMARAHEAASRVLGHPLTVDGIVITSDFVAQGVLDVLAETPHGQRRLPIVCLLSAASRVQTRLPLVRLLADGFAIGQAAGQLLNDHIVTPHTAAQQLIPSCTWQIDRLAPPPDLRDWQGKLIHDLHTTHQSLHGGSHEQ